MGAITSSIPKPHVSPVACESVTAAVAHARLVQNAAAAARQYAASLRAIQETVRRLVAMRSWRPPVSAYHRRLPRSAFRTHVRARSRRARRLVRRAPCRRPGRQSADDDVCALATGAGVLAESSAGRVAFRDGCKRLVDSFAQIGTRSSGSRRKSEERAHFLKTVAHTATLVDELRVDLALIPRGRGTSSGGDCLMFRQEVLRLRPRTAGDDREDRPRYVTGSRVTSATSARGATWRKACRRAERS